MTFVPEQTALIVSLAATESLVGAWRQRHDSSAAHGVPAHVTVLYPFIERGRLDDRTIVQLHRLVARHPQFDVSFPRCKRFPGVLYLEPEPAAPFRDLTAQVVESWPAYPPYGGAYERVVPHLTIAEGVDEATMDRIEAAVSGGLPITTRVTEAVLLTFQRSRWQPLLSLPLAAARALAAAPHRRGDRSFVDPRSGMSARPVRGRSSSRECRADRRRGYRLGNGQGQVGVAPRRRRRSEPLRGGDMSTRLHRARFVPCRGAGAPVPAARGSGSPGWPAPSRSSRPLPGARRPTDCWGGCSTCRRSPSSSSRQPPSRRRGRCPRSAATWAAVRPSGSTTSSLPTLAPGPPHGRPLASLLLQIDPAVGLTGQTVDLVLRWAADHTAS